MLKLLETGSASAHWYKNHRLYFVSLSTVTKTRHLYPNLRVAKENKPNKEEVAVTQLSKIHTMGWIDHMW